MVVFVTGTSLLKISILLFYRRMVAGTFNRYWIFATWGAIALTAAYLVAFDLLLIFNCQPTRAYWMAHDPEWEAKVNYYCLDTTQVINPIAGGLSVFSDIYAIVLPCLMVQGLDMTRRQKIGLNAVFATGIFMVAGGGMRTWYRQSCRQIARHAGKMLTSRSRQVRNRGGHHVVCRTLQATFTPQ